MNDRPPSLAAVPESRPAFLPKLFPWLVAFGFSLGCLWLVQLYLTARAENALLRDRQTLIELELRSLRQQLEAERILAHATQKRFAEVEESFSADFPSRENPPPPPTPPANSSSSGR